MLKAMWLCLLQLSSSQNWRCRARAILVKLLNQASASQPRIRRFRARARFVRQLLIYRHRCKSVRLGMDSRPAVARYRKRKRVLICVLIFGVGCFVGLGCYLTTVDLM